MTLRRIALAIAISLIGLSPTQAAPTPVPGGANQVSAISGKVGQTIFNGVLRIKIVELRDATPADHPERVLPTPDQKVMVMSVLLRNGAPSEFTGLIEYTLADRDDVSFTIPDSYVSHANLDIQQGAAARQTALFVVDKDFTPTKLLVQCVTCGARSAFRTLRLTI